MLAVTRGRKKLFTLLPMPAKADHSEIIATYSTTPDGDDKTKLWETLSQDQQGAIIDAFNEGA
jgi:hypothetical protein